MLEIHPAAGSRNDVTYPHVEVRLSGTDGNVFALLGRVVRALRIAGVSPSEILEFQNSVFGCGSYDEALQLFMRTVTVT